MHVRVLYKSVTAQIIKDLAAGTPPWTKPWKARSGGIMPHNAITKRSYSGINIPILWHGQQMRGFPTAGWLTYKQAQAAGAQVRGGEKATTVVFTKRLTFKDDEDVEKQVNMLRTFAVFNRAQVDGLPDEVPPPELTPEQRDNEVLRFVQATEARIEYGGSRAYYSTQFDHIGMPNPTDFATYEHFLATLLHELVHYSGAKHRLNRDLTGRFGTQSYAAEELVAELGAAFLCAHLDVTGQLRHADYISNWLQLLKHDDRAIFTAASKASQAADYLRSFSEQLEEAV